MKCGFKEEFLNAESIFFVYLKEEFLAEEKKKKIDCFVIHEVLINLNKVCRCKIWILIKKKNKENNQFIVKVLNYDRYFELLPLKVNELVD